MVCRSGEMTGEMAERDYPNPIRGPQGFAA
jgi:hypothetical protein